MQPMSPPPRDNGTIWILVAALAAAALALGAVLGGCGAPRIECPLGTYPRRAEARTATSGSTQATGSLPKQEITVGGPWSGSAESHWECTPVCPPLTAPRLHESARGRRLECIDLAPLRRPGGPDGG